MGVCHRTCYNRTHATRRSFRWQRRCQLIILSTGSLYTFGLARVFPLAAAAGFDGIEVLIDHRWDTRDAAYLRHLSRTHDLPIAALHSPFVLRVAGWPSDQLGRLERTIALARELGVPLIVTHLPYRLHVATAQWHAAAGRQFVVPVPLLRKGPFHHLLREGRLEQLLGDGSVTVTVENMPARRALGLRVSGYWFNRPSQLAQFPHLTLDTTHLGTWGLDPLRVYQELKDRVRHVHLSNYDGREHRLPQHGHLQLGEFLRQLARDGFGGTICVETDPSVLPVEDEAACLDALQCTLTFCREHFAST